MTNDQRLERLEAEVTRLTKLLDTTIKIQQNDWFLLESIHDRLLFSPPLKHAVQFFDYLQNDMDELGEQVDATNMGLNRVRADMPDTGRSVNDPPPQPKPAPGSWNPNL